jgi:hypothetical protein
MTSFMMSFFDKGLARDAWRYQNLSRSSPEDREAKTAESKTAE